MANPWDYGVTGSVISEITDLALALAILQDVVPENGTVEVSDGHEDINCSSHHIFILIRLLTNTQTCESVSQEIQHLFKVATRQLKNTLHIGKLQRGYSLLYFVRYDCTDTTQWARTGNIET